eukprot:TRINITY_DN14162_c0_g2_i10.p1 TRINITY_DN14162_c0_g2~~TRINITY_DN14162_c0_g2_i10.p1  ORF type:complete len:195 (-),score=39.12 TRINITY_DN14162_c0_g2_i10:16-600(-)
MSSSASFWKDFSFPSNCDKILEEKTIVLERLLDEDDIITDSKEQKPVLLNHLLLQTTIQRLLDYLTQEPPLEASDSVKYRYPAVVGEIFSSKIEAIDRTISSPEYLGVLFGFWKTEHVNTLIGPVVMRVIGSLLITQTGAVCKEEHNNKFLFFDAPLDYSSHPLLPSPPNLKNKKKKKKKKVLCVDTTASIMIQ